MDNFAQCSDLPLKRLGMIENYDIRTWSTSELVDIATDELNAVSRRNTHHTRNGDVAPTTTKIPLASVNLEDKGIYRHWSPGSQIFVGGDTLLTALDGGWKIAGSVLRQEYSCISKRRTYVYHLELHRDAERGAMKVVENPWVTRLLHQLQVEIAMVTVSL